MKLLFILEQGIGNVMQTIPLYLCLKERYKIDVVYLKKYPTDSIGKADCFPCDHIRQIAPRSLAHLHTRYDKVIKPPYIIKGGEYVTEDLVKQVESQSEVRRNLVVCDHFGVEQKMLKDLRINKSEYRGDIVLHNGAVKGWERKRYPLFGEVIKQLNGRYRITSIGAPDEYIEGTIDGTGTDLQTTAGTIKNHKMYLGTDTGTYHIAATMDKPGIALFTATSDTKNWDKEFHSTIDILRTDYHCQPCQWGYHFSPDWHECPQHLCMQIPPNWVVEGIKLKLKGVL